MHKLRTSIQVIEVDPIERRVFSTQETKKVLLLYVSCAC